MTTPATTTAIDLRGDTDLYAALGEAQGRLDAMTEILVEHGGYISRDHLLRVSDDMRDEALRLITIADELTRTALEEETRHVRWVAGHHEVVTDDEQE